MKRFHLALLGLLGGSLIFSSIVLSIQNSSLATSDLVITTPLATLENGALPIALLAETALMNARLSGLDENISVEDVDISQGIITTFRDWVVFNGGEAEPEPGELGAENFERPLFVISFTGSGIRASGGPPLPPEHEKTYQGIVIVLFADTGEYFETWYIQSGVMPDFSDLRNMSTSEDASSPSDSLPLPDAPEGDMRGSS